MPSRVRGSGIAPSGPGAGRSVDASRAIAVPADASKARGRRVVGVLVADDPVRPVEKQPAVLGGHAQHVGQRQQRQVGGDVLGEVASPLVAASRDHPVDTIARACARIRSSSWLTARGVNDRISSRRSRGMVRRIHVQHHLADVVAAPPESRGRGSAWRRARTRTARGWRHHRLDVGVAEHQPEPGATGPAKHGPLLDPDHRTVPSELCQSFEGHAFGVRRGIENGVGARQRQELTRGAHPALGGPGPLAIAHAVFNASYTPCSNCP